MSIEKLGITPGPWEYYVENINATHSGIGEYIVYFHTVRSSNELNVVRSSSSTDARLISAAPEMLEALIDFYDDWKHIEYTDPDVFIKPLIEKATGRTWAEIKELVNE